MQPDSRVRVSIDAVKVAGEVLSACCLYAAPVSASSGVRAGRWGEFHHRERRFEKDGLNSVHRRGYQGVGKALSKFRGSCA